MTTQAQPTLKEALERFFVAYPHLKGLVSRWGTQEGREQIASLVMDTRDGQRQGFPGEHAETLLRLLREHDAKFPQFEPKQRFDWTTGGYDGRLERQER